MRFVKSSKPRFERSQTYRATFRCKDSLRTFEVRIGYNPRRNVDYHLARVVEEAKQQAMAHTGYPDARIRLIDAKVI